MSATDGPSENREGAVADPQTRVEELELKLRQRDQDLKDAHRELEGFLYTISHDFRAVLRAIMSSSMILLEDYGGALDDAGKEELNRQSIAARKLNSLLDELLKLSRLSRHEMRCEQVDLSELADDVVADTALTPDQISVDTGCFIVGDPALLKQALLQILDNSVKFSRPDVPLHIEMGRQGDRYFVRDNGIGIDAEAAARIFLPFERIHGDQYPGTGMGLAVVKRIFDRHEGRVYAEGRPGEGITIWFTVGGV